jgi:hypothetical protein
MEPKARRIETRIVGPAAMLVGLTLLANVATAQAGSDDPVKRHLALLEEGIRKGDDRQAIEAMGLLRRRSEDPRVLKAFINALARPHPVGTEAALHLGALEEVRAVPALIARARVRTRELKKPDRKRLVAILQALGAIGDGRAAPALLKAMKHPDPEVARTAIQAMVGLRSRRHRAIERMIGYLESLGSSLRNPSATTGRKRYEALSGYLVATLSGMTGHPFTADTTAMRRWWRKNKKKVPDRVKRKKKKGGEEKKKKKSGQVAK